MAIRVFQEEIKEVFPDIWKLFQIIYPSAGSGMESRLRWKYLANPAGLPFVWTARQVPDNELCGCILAMPWNLWVGGKEKPCLQIGDLMVHPDFRRQGVAYSLFEEGTSRLRKEPYEVLFAFVETGGASHRGVQKFGIRNIDHLRWLKRVILPSYLAEKYFGNAIGKWFLPLDSWRKKLLKRAIRKFSQYELSPVKNLDSSFFAKCNEFADSSLICCRRTAEYLHWRFGGLGENGELWALTKHGKIEAYAVLVKNKGWAQLMDFYPWSRCEAAQALWAHLAFHLSEKGCRLLQTLASSRLGKAIRKQGMISRGKGWTLVGLDLKERTSNEWLLDRTRWSVTPGDCDVTFCA